MIRIAVPLAAAILLSACSDDPAPVTAEGDERRAEGDVLEGSISDAMLPLDTVQSQSPPLQTEQSSESSGDSESAEASDTGGAEQAPENPSASNEETGSEEE